MPAWHPRGADSQAGYRLGLSTTDFIVVVQLSHGINTDQENHKPCFFPQDEWLNDVY